MTRSPLLVFPLSLLFAQPGTAADWKAELARPVVKLVAGKMIYARSEICTLPDPAVSDGERSFQVRTRSEAPEGKFISRDNFVAVTALVEAQVLEQLGDVDCKSLSAPIGTPDFEVSMVMTPEGLQVGFRDTGSGQTTRSTMRWEDVLGD